MLGEHGRRGRGRWFNSYNRCTRRRRRSFVRPNGDSRARAGRIASASELDWPSADRRPRSFGRQFGIGRTRRRPRLTSMTGLTVAPKVSARNSAGPPEPTVADFEEPRALAEIARAAEALRLVGREASCSGRCRGHRPPGEPPREPRSGGCHRSRRRNPRVRTCRFVTGSARFRDRFDLRHRQIDGSGMRRPGAVADQEERRAIVLSIARRSKKASGSCSQVTASTFMPPSMSIPFGPPSCAVGAPAQIGLVAQHPQATSPGRAFRASRRRCRDRHGRRDCPHRRQTRTDCRR